MPNPDSHLFFNLDNVFQQGMISCGSKLTSFKSQFLSHRLLPETEHYQLSEPLPELLSKPSPAHLFYTNAKYLDKLSPPILQAKMGVTGRAGPTIGGG